LLPEFDDPEPEDPELTGEDATSVALDVCVTTCVAPPVTAELGWLERRECPFPAVCARW
jgi:hypothetical protein